jgi:hypothetical protein
MKAPFPPVHSPFGGSVAARILHCPASVQLIKKVPAYLHKSSAYALRGTVCHAAMTLLLDENPPSIESFVGKTINDYLITDDDVENYLRPAYTYAASLIDTPGAEYYLEHRVVFPTIPGAFGTADLIVRIGNTVHVVDHKFGSGVRVLALCPAGNEYVLNEQLMFYAAAARDSLPEFFAGVKNIILTIVQPVTIEPNNEVVSSVTVTHAELDKFVATYRAACEEALSDAPRLAKGAWCRFCPAKLTCPAHTGPLLDLAQYVLPATDVALKQTYLELVACGLDLLDAIKDLRTTLHDQAKRALENGDVVPGYTLSTGRAERHWRDDERTAIAALESLGLSRDDIIAETMRSPKQVEIRAKARSLKIPSEFIISTRSGTSLARVENAHVPAPGRSELVRRFSGALKAFQEEGSGADNDEQS